MLSGFTLAYFPKSSLVFRGMTEYSLMSHFSMLLKLTLYRAKKYIEVEKSSTRLHNLLIGFSKTVCSPHWSEPELLSRSTGHSVYLIFGVSRKMQKIFHIFTISTLSSSVIRSCDHERGRRDDKLLVQWCWACLTLVLPQHPCQFGYCNWSISRQSRPANVPKVVC